MLVLLLMAVASSPENYRLNSLVTTKKSTFGWGVRQPRWQKNSFLYFLVVIPSWVITTILYRFTLYGVGDLAMHYYPIKG